MKIDASESIKPKVAIVMGDYGREVVYSDAVRERIQAQCELLFSGCPGEFDTQVDDETAASIDFLFSGWGCPLLDEAFLSRVSGLRAVFYGAGTIKSTVTDAFWKRGIPICSAASANAVPVAEYSFAQVILCLKKAYLAAGATRAQRGFRWPEKRGRVGTYGATVGLVSLGEIARLLAVRLASLDVKVIAYDPFCASKDAAALGVELVPLKELFEQSDVVSIHAPSLPETKGMIGSDLLERLGHGAALINTARGAVIDQDALIRFLGERPDIQAVLDVTEPEPPSADSELYTLPNVFLTPHLAGSIDRECARMGMVMVDELERFLNGDALLHSVAYDSLMRMA